MQVRADALDAHLEKSLAPLYVISSDEQLLLLEAADRIRAKARAAGFSEREVLVAERYFKWGELQSVQQSMSLFGDRKLIELRIPSGKPGKEGAQALQDYAAGCTGSEAGDTLTLITLQKLDWATQKSAWVGALQRQAIYIEIANIERAQLATWIGQRLASQGQSADKHALEFMVDRVEGNLLAAHQEIRKLALLYPEGRLSLDQIQDAVLNVARYDVFKLSEAMLSGDVGRVARMLDGLKGEGEALPLVLWSVSEEIRTLLKLKIGSDEGRPLATMMKEYRIWGPRERLMGPALTRLKLSVLRDALGKAAQVDRMIKGLRAKDFAGDAWDALLQLALVVARK
ncbi:MAG: DNA polymerase III subunit delta [Burkholderiaceae bacterium]